MRTTLYAAGLVVTLVCIGCGQGVKDQPEAGATPAATAASGQQQPADAPDLAKEGFDAGDSEALQPSQGDEGGTSSDGGS